MTKLKKLCVLSAAAFVAALAAGSAADAEAQDRVRWKMHSAFGSKLPIVGTAGVRVADMITELSEGRFDVRFFEPGALVPGIQYYDPVAQGSIDAAWGTQGFDVNKNPTYAIFGSVPFGPAAGEYLAWMRFGGGNELWNELLARDGIKGYVCNIIPPEASGWFRRPIESIEDLRGLKMRFYGLGARVMEKFGVSTQLLVPGDIYPALELGTIDATEFSLPVMDEQLGFYQVAKHYYFPGWHQQSTLNELLVNKAAHDKLPKLYKTILETVCGYQTAYGIAEGEATQYAAIHRMQEKGVTIHEWPQEVIAKLEAAWLVVIEEETEKNADLKKAWESYAKFRENYAIWGRLGYLQMKK